MGDWDDLTRFDSQFLRPVGDIQIFKIHNIGYSNNYYSTDSSLNTLSIKSEKDI